MTRPIVAVLGLGEAGSAIAADLAAGGARVRAYDPAPRPVPPGVEATRSEADAAAEADFVLSVNWASAALEAARNSLAALRAGAVYAELNTAAPALKQEVAAVVTASGAGFADVALMAPVPGRGVRTPMCVSGDAAERFAAFASGFGTPVEVLGGAPGEAARRKLLRSVFMKGFAAVVVEALEAARAAGQGDWMASQIQEMFASPGEVRRLEAGTRKHARRRLHEMEAALDVLAELGVPSPVTHGTVASLRRLVEEERA
jgi:3-hydroxyisobutyrate dehydrogenase-like beta-hydroxyacid dehydrogenase